MNSTEIIGAVLAIGSVLVTVGVMINRLSQVEKTVTKLEAQLITLNGHFYNFFLNEKIKELKL